MSEPHNASAITVKLANPKMNVLKLAQLAARQNTAGNPLLAGIFVADAAMHTLGANLNDEYTKFKASPPASTKALVNSRINLLCNAYNKNAGFIQAAARDLVISSGDINQGINLVENSGYLQKNPRSATLKGFKVVPDGVGAVLISTKAVARNAIYIRLYGIAPAKDVVPPPEAIRPLLISHEADIRLINLKSVTCYAFCEGSLLPISRKPDSGTPTTEVEKAATPSAFTKAHKRTFIDSDQPAYFFGPWKWVVVL